MPVSASQPSLPWKMVSAGLVAMLVALAGCAESDENTATETQPANPRDVTAWSPSDIPSSPPITEDEQDASRLEQVAEILQVHDLPVPTSEDELPPLVKRVSVEESGPLIAQCLTDHGFTSTSIGGIVSTNDVADEQAKTYAKVRADCTSQYPIDAKYVQEWGADQWKVNYEYLVGYYVPCVESFGIVIDKDSIPEERTFIEAGMAGGDTWHPVFEWTSNPDYRDLRNDTTPEGAQLAEACRQSPPSNKLWG